MFRHLRIAMVLATCIVLSGIAFADTDCPVDSSRLIYPSPRKACLLEFVGMPSTFRVTVQNKAVGKDIVKRLSDVMLNAGAQIIDAKTDPKAPEIVLESTAIRHNTVFRQEGYSIHIDAGPPFVIRIGAVTHAGFLYAFQTLEQMISKSGDTKKIATGFIEDYPSFSYRGVLEGGYSVWGPAQRLDVIKWMGDYKMNYFIYAPKDGMYFRRLWRVPFPKKDLQDFREDIAACKQNDIVFAFALSPALSIEYSNPEEFKKLVAKYRQIQELGVSDFGIFFDDVMPVFYSPRDKKKYKNIAEAEADITNRLLKALRDKDPKARLFFVPNEYWGVKPTKYLTTLKEQLLPEIPIGWTGILIVSDAITKKDTIDFGAAIGRKPSIGDNWSPFGPLVDRDPDLGAVADSFVNNPYNFATDDEAQLSKFVDATVGDYAWNSEGYEPERSFAMGCRRIAGDAERGDLLLSAVTHGRKGPLFKLNARLKDVPAQIRSGADAAAILRDVRASLASLDERASQLGPALPGFKMSEQIASRIADFRKRIADEMAIIDLALAANGNRDEIASKIEKLPGVKQ